MSRLTLLLVAALLGCGGGKDSATTTTGTTTGSTGTPSGSTNGELVSPVADDDTTTVIEAGQVMIAVLDNDSDPDDVIDHSTLLVVTPPQYGTLTAGRDQFGYQHDGSEAPVDSFTYLVNDVLGHSSNVATVTITVTPVNDPPIALDDVAAVIEGAFTLIDLLANDTDADDVIDPSTLTITNPPAHGSITNHFDGTVTYQHDGAEAPMDGFRYRVSDSNGMPSAPGSVQITVTSTNDVPIAVDDATYCPPGESFDFDVLDNDIDPDDGLDVATVTIVTPPQYGTATVDASTGIIQYTHDGSDTLTDSLTYTVRDLSGQLSNVAVVAIDISVYVPPVLVGSFNVDDGPTWGSNPPVVTCLDACALLFGGLDSEYQCSTVPAGINNTARASGWGMGGCQTVGEDFAVGLGGGYNCGFPGCAISAYVRDNCTWGDRTNYCWWSPFPAP